ncbi:ABC transporter permease [Paenibacillus methanolicus]|uniref:Putative aldouronate transport system permease protein n=1 Tax=Paenibacillus methanolicus TaxID=582686 RepID=A0A5S5CHR2_9BACL|nr:ABC transporter permease subunit [Paenibacillus methanolicus]TYP79326.1 putative aldouronate transport system permease protein [Paenibacillus methanolicus]
MNTSIFRKIRRDRAFLVLLAPALIFYILFRYVPMFGIIVSFKDYNLFSGIWKSEWVGLRYYKMFFDNPDAFNIIRNTFLLGLYKIIFGFPAPIILALLLNELKMKRYKRFVQTVSYMPHFLSPVVVAGILVMILSPSTGFVNQIIQDMGFEPINFLQKADWFRTIYVSSEVWQEIGWGSILYLAALTSIDPQLYEAARMDGANRWRQMWHVSIPGIMPAIVILFILQIGKIMELGFDKVFLLSNAATYETADIISTYVYRMGITSANFSYATAIDLFMGIIGLIFVYSANVISRKLGDTSLW